MVTAVMNLTLCTFVQHRRTVDPANIADNGRRSRVFCVTGTFWPPACLPPCLAA